jgi:hypothetical protein
MKHHERPAYRDIFGLRFRLPGRWTGRGRRRLVPMYLKPPAAGAAFVLAVRGPHRLGAHQPAPEIADSKPVGCHRSALSPSCTCDLIPIHVSSAPFPLTADSLSFWHVGRRYDQESFQRARCQRSPSRRETCTSDGRYCTSSVPFVAACSHPDPWPRSCTRKE